MVYLQGVSILITEGSVLRLVTKMKKNKKIEGIKYKSSLNESGYCFVFFNKYRDSFCEENII